MSNETLRDKLTAWVEEYPSFKDHGWTGNERSDMVDSLWSFMEEHIGPVQEKLFKDLEISRERTRVAEREAAIVGDELARLLRDSASD
jgi:hypothetical protein